MNLRTDEIEDEINKALERERLARRRALLYTLLPVLFATVLVIWTGRYVAELRQKADQIKTEIAALESWKARLVQANEELSVAVKTATRAAGAVSPNVRAAENAKYAVGVYGFAVSADQYEQVRTRLQTEGYEISQGSLLEHRPSWLSPGSTVLYYEEASREKASNIAADLSKVTGANFAVVRGAGLGVLVGQERWSFFVHYVGK
jgi:hypothetical protein